MLRCSLSPTPRHAATTRYPAGGREEAPEPTPPPLPRGRETRPGVSEALLHFYLFFLAPRPAGSGNSASEPAASVTRRAPSPRTGRLRAAPRGGRRRGRAAAGRDPALPAARQGDIRNGGPATAQRFSPPHRAHAAARDAPRPLPPSGRTPRPAGRTAAASSPLLGRPQAGSRRRRPRTLLPALPSAAPVGPGPRRPAWRSPPIRRRQGAGRPLASGCRSGPAAAARPLPRPRAAVPAAPGPAPRSAPGTGSVPSPVPPLRLPSSSVFDVRPLPAAPFPAPRPRGGAAAQVLTAAPLEGSGGGGGAERRPREKKVRTRKYTRHAAARSAGKHPRPSTTMRGRFASAPPQRNFSLRPRKETRPPAPSPQPRRDTGPRTPRQVRRRRRGETRGGGEVKGARLPPARHGGRAKRGCAGGCLPEPAGRMERRRWREASRSGRRARAVAHAEERSRAARPSGRGGAGPPPARPPGAAFPRSVPSAPSARPPGAAFPRSARPPGAAFARSAPSAQPPQRRPTPGSRLPTLSPLRAARTIPGSLLPTLSPLSAARPPATPSGQPPQRRPPSRRRLHLSGLCLSPTPLLPCR
ncbi:basic proline-rich protein-like [Colius striatus]|uniref:basic proline-rich protein-like n=1 Tax=Colius striatus TaxID=57412 RepID=UPI002B1DDB08|nr:basic proline-rich protein-like [Colius striatus]